MRMPTPYTADQRTGLHSLVHRWFVEYNPFYLLSAALVFYGSSLLTSGLQSEESLSWSSLSALVSQAYAFALLGGVALLVRIDRRRPAVVLALLFLLYQWDLTLHTETSAYLGTAGLVSALVWLALFVGKLFAIGWALKVRFAPRFLAATTLGAAGLVFGPRLIPELGAVGSGMMVGAWVFALGALGPFSGGITSLAELSPWGRTVLRRATRAAWIVSGVLLGIHVLYFWAKDHEIALAMAWPAIPLLYVRKVRSEGVAWGYVLGVLFFVAVGAPYLLSSVAVLAAAALVLRALSPIFSVRQERLGRGVFVLDALSPKTPLPPARSCPSPRTAAAAACSEMRRRRPSPAPRPSAWTSACAPTRAPCSRFTSAPGPSAGMEAPGPRTSSSSTARSPSPFSSRHGSSASIRRSSRWPPATRTCSRLRSPPLGGERASSASASRCSPGRWR
jgi:hypothetical protein